MKKMNEKIILDTKFDNVYLVQIDNEKAKLATINFSPGYKSYDEEVIKINDIEYRIWNPFRSKIAGAILNNMDVTSIIKGHNILYLGSSTGTTVSHLSDIKRKHGNIYSVELSPRVMREFIERVARQRTNVFPILADARYPDNYSDIVGKSDVIYSDISQPDQTIIAIRNAKRFLNKNGRLYLIIKARSIDATLDIKKIFLLEKKKLVDAGFEILHFQDLHPHHKDHAILIAKINK